MRVVVRKAFKAYINHQPEDFTPGQKIKGDTAVYLLRSNAAVDPEDDEAAAFAAELAEDQDHGGDGQEQEPPHTPPTPNPDPDDGPPPPPSDELNIDGPVKDVLAWVGEDAERAREALQAEQAKAEPRSTLVKQLEKTAAPAA